LAAVVETVAQLVPPSSDRSTRNPSSIAELSVQVTSIVLLLHGTASVAEGAFGVGGAGVVAQAVLEKSE